MINDLFEANLSSSEKDRVKPDNHTEMETRANFIFDKYQHRKWYSEAAGSAYKAPGASAGTAKDASCRGEPARGKLKRRSSFPPPIVIGADGSVMDLFADAASYASALDPPSRVSGSFEAFVKEPDSDWWKMIAKKDGSVEKQERQRGVHRMKSFDDTCLKEIHFDPRAPNLVNMADTPMTPTFGKGKVKSTPAQSKDQDQFEMLLSPSREKPNSASRLGNSSSRPQSSNSRLQGSGSRLQNSNSRLQNSNSRLQNSNSRLGKSASSFEGSESSFGDIDFATFPEPSNFSKETPKPNRLSGDRRNIMQTLQRMESKSRLLDDIRKMDIDPDHPKPKPRSRREKEKIGDSPKTPASDRRKLGRRGANENEIVKESPRSNRLVKESPRPNKIGGDRMNIMQTLQRMESKSRLLEDIRKMDIDPDHPKPPSRKPRRGSDEKEIIKPLSCGSEDSDMTSPDGSGRRRGVRRNRSMGGSDRGSDHRSGRRGPSSSRASDEIGNNSRSSRSASKKGLPRTKSMDDDEPARSAQRERAENIENNSRSLPNGPSGRRTPSRSDSDDHQKQSTRRAPSRTGSDDSQKLARKVEQGLNRPPREPRRGVPRTKSMEAEKPQGGSRSQSVNSRRGARRQSSRSRDNNSSTESFEDPTKNESGIARRSRDDNSTGGSNRRSRADDKTSSSRSNRPARARSVEVSSREPRDSEETRERRGRTSNRTKSPHPDRTPPRGTREKNEKSSNMPKIPRSPMRRERSSRSPNERRMVVDPNLSAEVGKMLGLDA